MIGDRTRRSVESLTGKKIFTNEPRLPHGKSAARLMKHDAAIGRIVLQVGIDARCLINELPKSVQFTAWKILCETLLKEMSKHRR